MSAQCKYCNACLPCPEDIDIAAVTNLLDRARASDQIPEQVKSSYDALKVKAKNCVMCGRCERKCPFGVKVRDNMRAAERLFGK